MLSVKNARYAKTMTKTILLKHPLTRTTIMSVKIQTEKDFLTPSTSIKTNKETENEKVLCSHCRRTATNGIKCKGMCVADNDY